MPRISQRRTMWFDVPDDPLHGRVEIVHLEDGEVTEIREQVWEMRNVFDADSPAGFKSEQRYNPALDRELTVCRAVGNWENFQDADGKPMACTEGNKKQWSRVKWFMEFVNECREQLAKLVREERKTAAKN